MRYEFRSIITYFLKCHNHEIRVNNISFSFDSRNFGFSTHHSYAAPRLSFSSNVTRSLVRPTLIVLKYFCWHLHIFGLNFCFKKRVRITIRGEKKSCPTFYSGFRFRFWFINFTNRNTYTYKFTFTVKVTFLELRIRHLSKKVYHLIFHRFSSEVQNSKYFAKILESPGIIYVKLVTIES